MPDTGMKNAPKPDAPKAGAGESGEPPEGGGGEAAAPATRGPVTVADVERNVGMIVRAVDIKQNRLVLRALSRNTTIRRRIQPSVLADALGRLLHDGCPAKAKMVALLGDLPNDDSLLPKPPAADTMEVEGQSGEPAPAGAGGEAGAAGDAAAAPPAEPAAPAPAPAPSALPEVEVYLSTLVLTTVMRCDKVEEAAALATELLERSHDFNRRSMDTLSAKVALYFSLAHERAGRASAVRPRLLALHRTCCLRHDEPGQATALNLLLRNLLANNLIDQAHKLASKTNFPETCSNNQFCRYLYYMGRIQALQLDYSDAYTKLVQGSRKAPQNTAMGFQRAVQKLTIIVQLLLGEVPERSAFKQKGFRAALAPYLQLTQAVRQGDLVEFNKAVEQHKDAFQADKTYTLIQRLAHNVIKTGLRKINLSYSRISLKDLCDKVKLDSVQTAEFVCAKAVRDGVIDAVLDHEKGWLKSQELTDLYATDEPMQAFHKRITFCLDVHNDAVRAMRYPPNAYKKELLSLQRLGLDEKSEEELAKEIEDEMDEDHI